MRRFIAVSVLSLFLLGCAQDFVEKDSEVANEGAYGVPAAISNGRIDKAYSFSNSLKTLYPAPKHPLDTRPIIDPATGLPDVILPSFLTGKVKVVGTAEYNDLIKNKAIAAQLAKDNKGLTEYKTAAEKQKIADDATLNAVLKELNGYKNSIFYKAYKFCQVLEYVLPISVIAIIALVIFVPTIGIPLVSIIGTLCGLFVRFIKFLISLI